ncbi:hypothetical protein LTR28_013796 [Elasticomyces elasticus]|nr:hypothetical protein LTR28_013796 [Elasticomyces elasticus]
MMSSDEKTTFGATIDPPSNAHPLLRSNSQSDTPLTLTPTATRQSTIPTDITLNMPPPNPHSPFYAHPCTRTSLEQLRNASKTHLDIYETAATPDLEAGGGTYTPFASSTTDLPPHYSNGGAAKECAVWPSKQTLKQQQLLERRRRRPCARCYCCGFMQGWSKKQRLLFQLLIALFVVAAAVGLGVGISRAVGGGVWAGNSHTRPIPTDHS